MGESVLRRKARSVGVHAIGMFLLIVVQGTYCETVSAQQLMDRLRARIEARQAAQLRPPAVGMPDRDPTGSALNPDDRTGGPRILATPTPGQRLLPSQRPPALRPPGQLSPPEAPGGQATAPVSFGIEVLPIHSGQFQGLRVQGFSPDSNAPAVGIQVGDLIVSIDGIRTDSLAAVAAAQRQSAVGQPAVVHVIRDGRLYQTQLSPVAREEARPSAAEVANEPSLEHEASAGPARSSAKAVVQAQAADLARPRLRASLGIEASDAAPHRGVLIVTAREGAAGSIAGLKPGDRIVSTAGRLVRDTNSLIREIAVLNPGDSVTFGVVRGQSMQEIEVEMGDPNGLLMRSASDEVELPPTASILNPGKTASPMTKPAPAPTASGKSLLEGVGSVLGDFFSGEAAKKIDAPPPTPSPTAAEAVPTDPLALPEDTAEDMAEDMAEDTTEDTVVEDTLPAPVETP